MPQLHKPQKPDAVAILLAAGQGTRFDATGEQNKLLQILPNGDSVIQSSAKRLLAVLPDVLAVVRPGADEVARQLRDLGCQVSVCEDADGGIGHSLLHAMLQSRTMLPQADSLVIALGDMPWVQSATIQLLLDAVTGGAAVAVPFYQGLRGNPVAFNKAQMPDMEALRGDQGARSVLPPERVAQIDVQDIGVVRDVDFVADLAEDPDPLHHQAPTTLQ